MSLPLDFHPAVRPEVEDAYRWYERRSSSGRDFLDAVEAVTAEVTVNPARFGFVDGDVRAAPVGRFPYAEYYRALPDRTLVLAIQHTARDPRDWKSRV